MLMNVNSFCKLTISSIKSYEDAISSNSLSKKIENYYRKLARKVNEDVDAKNMIILDYIQMTKMLIQEFLNTIENNLLSLVNK